MLKPNNSWKWYFDDSCQSLMLDLGHDMVFRVQMPAKDLVPDAYISNPFTVDDASLFQTFNEAVRYLPLSGPRKAELALNAVAAYRYHKPILPKSWFFENLSEGYEPEMGELVMLQTEYSAAPFLLVENAGTASLCMYAGEETFQLDGRKSLDFCQPIKVMNDRVAVVSAQMLADPSYALVG